MCEAGHGGGVEEVEKLATAALAALNLLTPASLNDALTAV